MIILLRNPLSDEDCQKLFSNEIYFKSFPKAKTPLLFLNGKKDVLQRSIDVLEQKNLIREMLPAGENTPLSSIKESNKNSIVEVGSHKVGSKHLWLITGPCSAESRQQLFKQGQKAIELGAHALRGGAFKPRTHPYSFEGFGIEALEWIAEIKKELQIPVVSEILDVRNLSAMHDIVDCFQVGARNMQNYTLLQEIGRTQKPVLLKRGFAATVDEWLCAAEHIMAQGNNNVILCERGLRHFSQDTRFNLDITGIIVAKTRTHLPIIADPSHASGNPLYISTLAKAAIAAGADGLMIETHDDPENAKSDGFQAIQDPHKELDLEAFKQIAHTMGKKWS